MKILGEELGEVGRWYIALPPILLIGFLIGLFFSRRRRSNPSQHDQ